MGLAYLNVDTEDFFAVVVNFYLIIAGALQANVGAVNAPRYAGEPRNLSKSPP